MKILFLFYTQAEGGAPGFLSRGGEEAAGNLAQTIFAFLQTSLGIDLESGSDARATSLNEDVQWRSFKSAESFGDALKTASCLFPEVLFFSGESTRSVKTAEPVAQACALPVCVDKRLDRCSQDKPATGILSDALGMLIESGLSSLENPPRCILVSTSQSALLEWTQGQMPAVKWSEFSEVFQKSTCGDTIPAVFACGLEKNNDSVQWIFE